MGLPSVTNTKPGNPATECAEDVLRRYWGHESFRPGQSELIEAVLAGRDAFGVLPTGAGKSVCYQLPAVMLSGMTLVISPLIALMEDQVRSLSEKGIPAASLSGAMGKRPWDAVLNDARHGRYKILFVSPERLQAEIFRAQFDALDIALIAVDEAHCISEWGHEFRPDYFQIADLYAGDGDNSRAPKKRPPVIAVTATATPVVRNDIVSRLKLEDPVQVTKSFDRPNLSFSVFSGVPKHAKVADILRSVQGSSIIYAPTRRRVESWGRQLASSGETVSVYHAGMTPTERSEAQHNWITGQRRIIVATNAFGMGVDNPDVRSVIHVGLPMSMEAYYQEAGRAGRDGGKAYAALIINKKDISDRQSMVAGMYPPSTRIRKVYDALLSTNGIAVGNMTEDALVVNQEALSRATKLENRAVSTVLEFMVRNRILTRDFRSATPGLFMTDSRAEKLPIDGRRLRRMKNGALNRLRDVLAYVKERDCRRKHLVAHFDDFSTGRCGMCDNCLGRHEAMLVEPRLTELMVSILKGLERQDSVYDAESVQAYPHYRVDEMIDWLAIHGYIELSDDPAANPRLTDLGAAVVLH